MEIVLFFSSLVFPFGLLFILFGVYLGYHIYKNRKDFIADITNSKFTHWYTVYGFFYFFVIAFWIEPISTILFLCGIWFIKNRAISMLNKMAQNMHEQNVVDFSNSLNEKGNVDLRKYIKTINSSYGVVQNNNE